MLFSVVRQPIVIVIFIFEVVGSCVALWLWQTDLIPARIVMKKSHHWLLYQRISTMPLDQ